MQADYSGALNDLDKAIGLFPGNSYAFSTRAKIRSKIGDKKGAITDYRKQLELDPKNKEAQLRLGKELIADRQCAEALAFFNKVINPTVKNGKFYIERGIAMSGLGDSKGAFAEFNKAMTIDTNVRSLAYANIGNTKLMLKDYDGAGKDFNIAITKDQNNDDAYFYSANLKMHPKKLPGGDLRLHQRIINKPR